MLNDNFWHCYFQDIIIIFFIDIFTKYMYLLNIILLSKSQSLFYMVVFWLNFSIVCSFVPKKFNLSIMHDTCFMKNIVL